MFELWFEEALHPAGRQCKCSTLREVVFEKRAFKLILRPPTRPPTKPPRDLYAPVLWAGSALRNEPNLITTIDADLPTPQTPPSPILMRGGMERPVWCFHPQGLG